MFRSNGSINYLRSLLGLGGKKKPASKPGKMFKSVLPNVDGLEPRFVPASVVFVDDDWKTKGFGELVNAGGTPAIIGTDAFGSIGPSTTIAASPGGAPAGAISALDPSGGTIVLFTGNYLQWPQPNRRIVDCRPRG